ncbi:GTP-binding protein [Ectothiorhodospira shaposhnikovii]|uniref:GTP-binding protein n=1 Tax=Ectothiorhodospira shaposhnikovii TaxID=1054 RepID=UPI0019071D36|nr:ATP/GTP-binding protein [Ectothiorhodospira shaposhnikovii]MBK1674168.1 GTP-binding protein [Ectothiorhodospira shaposhnikovii]
MPDHKIIFTGPVGAGKTTAITAISDSPALSTDVRASDMTREMKATTTVAMDYGVMVLEGGDKVHLYGTPGQERFDFMWKILTQGGLGLVLLIDDSRPNPRGDMEFFLAAFEGFIRETHLAIGITKTDLRPGSSSRIDHYQEPLQRAGLVVPVFEVDARKRSDILLLLEALFFSLDPDLEMD